MKMRTLVLAAAAILAFGCTVSAEETAETPAQPLAQEEGESGETELAQDWTAYQLQVDGEVYSFPMTQEEWATYGWTAKDEMDDILEPYQYSMYRYEKDDNICTVFLLNLGINNTPASQCIVAGISIDSFDWSLDNGEVVLPGGLVRGQADGDAIVEAYGTPTNTYEGDLYTSYTYETDYNSSVELSVWKESGVLEEIDVRNFVEPEGFEAGEVNEETPEAVAAYEKPEKLSEELKDYQIELDGQCYAMPVPVSVLLADGWELDESYTDPTIPAKSSGWVGLRKGGQSFHEIVTNDAEYATIPENCWLESLEVGGYTLELDGALPCGIRTGITEDELLSILETTGAAYTTEESGSHRYYTILEESYSKKYEAIVYTDEDGSFPQNTVSQVSCYSPVEN